MAKQSILTSLLGRTASSSIQYQGVPRIWPFSEYYLGDGHRFETGVIEAVFLDKENDVKFLLRAPNGQMGECWAKHVMVSEPSEPAVLAESQHCGCTVHTNHAGCGAGDDCVNQTGWIGPHEDGIRT